MKKAKLISDLRDIQRLATMQTAHFERVCPGPNDLPYPTCEAEVNAFIKQRTQIWRDTWIVGMLNALIEDIEQSRARDR